MEPWWHSVRADDLRTRERELMTDVPKDDADVAFEGTLVPEGCVSQGFIAVAAYFDEDGLEKFKVYTQLDMPLHAQIGLLELSKRELIKRVEAEHGEDF